MTIRDAKDCRHELGKQKVTLPLTAVFQMQTVPSSLAVAMLPAPSAVQTKSLIAPIWLSSTGSTRPLPAATLQQPSSQSVSAVSLDK